MGTVKHMVFGRFATRVRSTRSRNAKKCIKTPSETLSVCVNGVFQKITIFKNTQKDALFDRFITKTKKTQHFC